MDGFWREDWWTPDQLTLVEDRSRVWREVIFQSAAATEFRVDGERLLGPGSIALPGSLVIPGG